MDIENDAGPEHVLENQPESRKVYPFSMRKLKEQAKKICNKSGGDFKLGLVSASFSYNSAFSKLAVYIRHRNPLKSNSKVGDGKIKVD